MLHLAFIGGDLDKEITMDELLNVLCRAKTSKAPGFNLIPVEFYKKSPAKFNAKLLE